jgi:hypothetical protein
VERRNGDIDTCSVEVFGSTSDTQTT